MKKRNLNLDIIKAIASFLVVLVHFYLRTDYYDINYDSKIMKISLVIRNIAMACVPLFILTTGYLLKGKNYNKRYFKNILNVYLTSMSIVLIAAILDKIFGLNKLNYNIGIIKLIIKSVIIFDYSSWYIYLYIGIALLAPICSLGYENLKSKKHKQIFVLVFIGLTILPGTVFEIINNLLIKFNLNNDKYLFLENLLPTYWIGLWPLVYLSTGIYFKDYAKDFKISKQMKILISTIVISTLTYILCSSNIKVQFIEKVFHANIFVYLTSVSIFLIIYNLNLKNISKRINKNIFYNFYKKYNTKLQNLIIFISNNTLRIYLISGIIDMFVYKKFNESITEPTIKLRYALIVSVFTYLLSIIITFGYLKVTKILTNILKNTLKPIKKIAIKKLN